MMKRGENGNEGKRWKGRGGKGRNGIYIGDDN